MKKDERRIVEGGDSSHQHQAGDAAKRAILALAGGDIDETHFADWLSENVEETS